MADGKWVNLAKFEEIVRCSVCLETYSFPKTLRCQHSFCISCLAKILRATLLNDDGVLNADRAISIACPVCTSVHQDINTLSDLATNFMAVQVLDAVLECHEKTDDTPLCGCLKFAVYICITCQREYCLDCRGDAARYCDHGKEHGGPAARHSIVGVHDKSREEYKCAKHNIILEYYCTVCEEPVCLDCFLVSHRNHNTKVISSVTQEIQKLSNELKDIHAKNEADQGQLLKGVTLSMKKVDDKQLEISEKLKQLHVKLQSFLDTLFAKIDAFCYEEFAKEKLALVKIAAEDKKQLWDGDMVENLVSFVNSKMSDHLLVAYQATVLKSMLTHGQEKSFEIKSSKEQFMMTAIKSSQATLEMDVVQLQQSMVKMFDKMTLKIDDGDRRANLKTFLQREFEALFASEESTEQNPQGAGAIGYKEPTEPFVPKSINEVEIGMKVLLTRHSRHFGKGTYVGEGTLKWKGKLHGYNEDYVGIELQTQDGNHDGSFDGRRYFYCLKDRGVFTTLKNVIRVWQSKTA